MHLFSDFLLQTYNMLAGYPQSNDFGNIWSFFTQFLQLVTVLLRLLAKIKMPKNIFFFPIIFSVLRRGNFHFLSTLVCFLNFIHDFFISRFVIKDSVFALYKFCHLNNKSSTIRKSSALSEWIAPLLDRIARF